MSDESIWRMRVLSTAMPEYVGELIRCKDCERFDPNEERVTIDRAIAAWNRRADHD